MYKILQLNAVPVAICCVLIGWLACSPVCWNHISSKTQHCHDEEAWSCDGFDLAAVENKLNIVHEVLPVPSSNYFLIHQQSFSCYQWFVCIHDDTQLHYTDGEWTLFISPWCHGCWKTAFLTCWACSSTLGAFVATLLDGWGELSGWGRCPQQVRSCMFLRTWRFGMSRIWGSRCKLRMERFPDVSNPEIIAPFGIKAFCQWIFHSFFLVPWLLLTIWCFLLKPFIFGHKSHWIITSYNKPGKKTFSIIETKSSHTNRKACWKAAESWIRPIPGVSSKASAGEQSTQSTAEQEPGGHRCPWSTT